MGSKAAGGSFEGGAFTAAFGYLFNQAVQSRQDRALTQAREDLADPRVRALLGTLAQRESGERYNVIAGGDTFDDFANHPNRLNPQLNSTAAGAYQFTNPTWRDASGALRLTNFTPENQDLAAAYMLRRTGATDHLINGRTNEAIFSAGRRWDAFPLDVNGTSISRGNRPLDPIVQNCQQRCGAPCR